MTPPAGSAGSSLTRWRAWMVRLPATTRTRVVALARTVFLLAVLAGAVWAFHDRGDEVWAAIGSTPVWAVAVSAALVLLGLVLTSVAWLGLLAAYGHALPGAEGRSVFFVGQLGKYVPGGVWSIGAHAHLARPYGVPVRVTAGTSLAFLGLNVATGAVVVGVAGLTGWASPLGDPVSVALVVGGALALTPGLVNRFGSALGGPGSRLHLTWPGVLGLVVLMALTWTSYAAGLVVLAPGRSTSLLALAAGAFALSYVVGVVVVVAPAGVGAREVTLVALLSPVVGLAAAGAITVLTRVVHTLGDLLLALVTWLLARRRVAERARAVVRADAVEV